MEKVTFAREPLKYLYISLLGFKKKHFHFYLFKFYVKIGLDSKGLLYKNCLFQIVQDISNDQNSKVVDQGQVTETGKPVPQEAATPQRPIFKIFFTIYVNMYSMEFFFDQ
jgi:hypothetical protein